VDVSGRHSVRIGAVLLGALLLIAPLAAVSIVAAAGLVAGFLGVGLDGSIGLLVSFGAAGIALEVAAEAAGVRLHGFAVLDRGNAARRVLRYGSIGATVLSGLVVAVMFLLDVFGWAVANDRVEYLLMSGVVAIALAWALFRAGCAFYSGYRERTYSRYSED
jgi:hypothetical protein